MMSDIHRRIQAFARLGQFIGQFSEEEAVYDEGVELNDKFFPLFKDRIEKAYQHNSWFNRENIAYSLKGWSALLTETSLKKWLSSYLIEDQEPKTIAIIMAGNIPLVGFHDYLSVLITGHRALVKQSSNDNQLLPLLAEYLEASEPSLKGFTKFTDDRITGFEAVIATGSDNTARYFEYYFGQKPNIIRKNRNSVAVLTGKETPEQLAALGTDIFTYYGLGCRSVSKLFVPRDYNFDPFFEAIYKFNDIINQDKYANNYDYNKAVYLMSLFKLLENGFLILKEDESYASPIGTVFYEQYDSVEDLNTRLHADAEKIQCIVSDNFTEGEITFGETQRPGLLNYADGKDTVKFLLNL